jgi:cytochrome c553
LLKADPNPAKIGNYAYYTPVEGETSQTVSQWCSACHNANFGASSEGKSVLKGSVSATVFGHASSSHGMTTTADGNPQVTLDDGQNNGPTCYDCHKADGRTGAKEFPHASGAAPTMLRAGSDQLQLDNICIGCHQITALP